MKPVLLSLLLCALVCARPASAADKPVLAVFGVESQGAPLKGPVLERMSDYVATLVAENGRYTIVPRDDVRRLLQQQKKDSFKNCFSESCQIELGKELAAETTLATQISKLGKSCVVTMKLFDLRTASSVGASTTKGGCDEDSVVASIEAAVKRLLVPAEVAKAPPPPAAAPPAPPPPAAAPVAEERPPAIPGGGPLPTIPTSGSCVMSNSKLTPSQLERTLTTNAGLERLVESTPSKAPDRPKLLFRLAMDEARIGTPEARSKAMEHYKRIVSDHPNYERLDEVAYGLVDCGFASNDPTNPVAREMLKLLSEKYPSSPRTADAWVRFGEVWEANGNHESAIDAYSKVLAIAPAGSLVIAYAYYRRAWCMRRTNQHLAVAPSYNKALEHLKSKRGNPDGVRLWQVIDAEKREYCAGCPSCDGCN